MAGSAVFRTEDYAATIKALKKARGTEPRSIADLIPLHPFSPFSMGEGVLQDRA